MPGDIVSGSIVGVNGDGWYFKESFTYLSPDGEANIIASSEPVEADLDSDAYAGVQGELLQKEFPGYEQYAFEPMLVFGDHSGYMRRFQWNPPNRDPVMQIQIYYASGGRGYTATATTSSGMYERFAGQLRAVLESLYIAPPEAPPGEVGPSKVHSSSPAPLPSPPARREIDITKEPGS